MPIYPLDQPVILGAGTKFKFSNITGLVQQLLYSKNSLAANLVDGTLIDSSTDGDPRPVQPARSYNFDGVDDHVEFPALLPTDGSAWRAEVEFFGATVSTSAVSMLSQYEFPDANRTSLVTLRDNELYFFHGQAGNLTIGTYVAGQTHKAVVEYDGTTLTTELNGVAGDSYTGPLVVQNVPFRLGATFANGELALQYEGNISRAKVSIGSNTVLDTGCNEGTGSICYNRGTGANGTIKNATESTFHATHSDGLGSDLHNQRGHTEAAHFNGTTAKRVYDSVLIGATADFDIEFKYVYYARSTTERLFGQYLSGETGRFVLSASTVAAPNTLRLFIQRGAGNVIIDALAPQVKGQCYAVRATRVGDVFSLYLDGVLQGEVTASGTAVYQKNTEVGHASSAENFLGAIFDLVVDGAPVTASYTDTNVRQIYFSPSVTDATEDALGNPLQYSGRVPYNADLVASHCASFDGVSYLSIPSLTGAETVVSVEGTAVPTIAAGLIDFTAGTAWNLVLSNGSQYPLAEGKGFTHYDVSGTGNHGTSVNATETTLWGTLQDSAHYNFEQGFDLWQRDSDNELLRVPYALDGTPIKTDGDSITGYTWVSTHPAGNYHNGAETGIKRNPNNAAELLPDIDSDNIIYSDTALINPEFNNNAFSPNKVKNFLVYKEEVSGLDLVRLNSNLNK